MSVRIEPGDCLEVMACLDSSSVDAIVCDPPYHLTSIVKRFSKGEPEHTKTAADIATRRTPIARLARGFMGKEWDGGDVAFRAETWEAAMRVLKPGAHLVAFSGTRTYHRMASAIEDAGFEIRDQLAWIYATGFPKSHNIGNGWGTALKPAWEPIVLARKPLSEKSVAANVLQHGTGAIHVDACRVEAEKAMGWEGRAAGGKTWTDENCGLSTVGAARPIEGRWPANILHDGSEEVVERFPQADIGGGPREARPSPGSVWGIGGERSSVPGGPIHGDSGSAARFFYCAKADADDRIESKHPTVKPVQLMRWLVRLVCPKGGLVLDPFAGTGTTGVAALREGCRAILIEREPEYQADIKRRIDKLSGLDAPLFAGSAA